tara:strand:+ start:542 stop:2380 length:1839 start_codon:yes stop_codon:yes gene_type:complete
MFHRALLILFAFYGVTAFAQEIPNYGSLESHTYFVKQLEHAKDQNFETILGQYDAFILHHPKNITALIERCKFVGNSYWDVYEEYNLKEEETESCIANLYRAYPNEPKVIIYRAENLYGEEHLALLKKAEKLIKKKEGLWSDFEMATIYQMLGAAQDEENAVALKYFVKAQEKNDSLDLSLPIARIYKSQGKVGLAKIELLRRLEQDTMRWNMNQKANLLLELGEPEKALYLYDVITKKDSTYIDNSEMAAVMKDLGNHDMSREFLVRDTLQEWNKTIKLQNLFNHDFEYASPEDALLSYRKLQAVDGNDDFLGIKRLMISFRQPFLAWKASEILHLVFFWISLLILLLIPYLWVLPIHSLGGWLKKNTKGFEPKLNFDWSIRHFWIISFLYLLAQYLVVLAFDYQEHMNSFFDIGTNYDFVAEDPNSLAKMMVWYVLAMGFATLFVLKKSVLKLLHQSNLSLLRILSMSIGFVILNGILLRFLGRFIDLSETGAPSVILSAKAEIIAILDTYGFLVAVICIAIIAPIYEEIIFRGVILGSVEKQIGFVAANLLQATLFSLIHFDLRLFLFYFIFGLVTGHLVRKTKGLLTGIVFHMVNNFVVVVTLYFATR